MLGYMEQTLAPSEQQTSNSGLDHKLCLNCQKNAANPPHIPGVSAGGILCRSCQRKVVEKLRSFENPSTREARLTREKAEAVTREARKAKEPIDGLLYE